MYRRGCNQHDPATTARTSHVELVSVTSAAKPICLARSYDDGACGRRGRASGKESLSSER